MERTTEQFSPTISEMMQESVGRVDDLAAPVKESRRAGERRKAAR